MVEVISSFPRKCLLPSTAGPEARFLENKPAANHFDPGLSNFSYINEGFKEFILNIYTPFLLLFFHQLN